MQEIVGDPEFICEKKSCKDLPTKYSPSINPSIRCGRVMADNIAYAKEGGGLRTPIANHQSFYGDTILSLIKKFCLTLYLLIC